jgi:nucleoid DNA-binding protein
MTAKPAEKPMSKTEIFAAVAEATGLAKKDVTAVFTAITDLIGKNVGKKGPGVFNFPGLMKIQVVRKPATKATTRPNPFAPGEMMKVAAKPARNVIKIRPLKMLKDMA